MSPTRRMLSSQKFPSALWRCDVPCQIFPSPTPRTGCTYGGNAAAAVQLLEGVLT